MDTWPESYQKCSQSRHKVLCSYCYRKPREDTPKLCARRLFYWIYSISHRGHKFKNRSLLLVPQDWGFIHEKFVSSFYIATHPATGCFKPLGSAGQKEKRGGKGRAPRETYGQSLCMRIHAICLGWTLTSLHGCFLRFFLSVLQGFCFSLPHYD